MLLTKNNKTLLKIMVFGIALTNNEVKDMIKIINSLEKRGTL